MLGWEFPPLVSGGLGVACYGLARALNGMGVDVMFVLPKPLAPRGNGHPPPSEGWRRTTRLVQTREVRPPSQVEVRRAVEQASAHAQAAQATDRGAPVPELPQNSAEMPGLGAAAATTPSRQAGRADAPAQAAPPISTEQVRAEESREVEDVIHLQRVTFVPVDVLLAPYMTPEQYHRMVVEDWKEKNIHLDTSGRWVERAVHAGPQGPIQQPPNRPGPTAAEVRAMPVPAPLAPRQPVRVDERDYIDAPSPEAAPRVMGPSETNYAGDLFSETDRYARLALAVAQGEKFGVVHAHDWMTFEAGMAVAAATGKPLIVQIHSTELDRAGVNANARIMELERQGMTAADRVIAVSYKTKTQLIEKYGIDPRKIEVVYNATDVPASHNAEEHAPLRKKQKTVLFLGRLTQQKGPDYFLRAAQKVAAVESDVKFVIAGKGDLLDDLKELALELGIKKKVVFTGFLKKDPVEKAFRSADVYVMPSLSEPFGIAPLEALAHDVPVIISKQSGVAEVLKHVLKVDFWDTEDLANKILAVLRHPPLAQTLRERGQEEVRQLSWDDSARRIAEVYEELAARQTEAVA
jgi:glycogen synthase